MAGSEPAGSEEDLQLRPGTAEDVGQVHDVYAAAVSAAAIPERRTPEQVRAWLDAALDAGRELWVATRGEEVLGFAVVHRSWLFLLFVHPGRAARGVGDALMGVVKARCPDGFGLRVHLANDRARAFYRRHGLVELETTDGSEYPDQEPDVKMAWLGPDPLAYLRRCIDEVDDELAVLLARRVALTAAVQDHKEVGGHAGRDRAREAEIVDRMARRVPSTDLDALAGIVHTVIEEGLAAWERGRGGQRHL